VVSFTVTVAKPCDPNLFSKAQREFDTAKSFYTAGVKELGDAANGIREFRDDYAKESIEIGAEKLTALDVLRSLSEHLFEAAEVTGLYVGIGVTIEELALKIIPLAREHGRQTREAHSDFERGDLWAARATADLREALAGGPCLGPIEQREKRLLDEQRLADQARALIESWDNSGYRYLSPITGEVLSEAAALKQARAALVSGSVVPPVAKGAALAARRRIRATAPQVRAALGHIEAAQAFHSRAAGQLARLYAASRQADRRLKLLLKAWPR
jgi:hypothetical protein